MMGRQKLIIGVVAGAVIGGVVSLFDKDTRVFVKTKCNQAKDGSSYYIKHPSEAVHNARNMLDTFNQTFSSGSANAINALEQVEETLDKFTNKNETKEIE